VADAYRWSAIASDTRLVYRQMIGQGGQA
jgi:hypothetical protein